MSDRLTSSPLPAKVCPNCDAYYIGIGCEACGWAEPDDDEVDEPTDEEPTQPDSPFDDQASGEQP